MPSTAKADFVNTLDRDETADKEEIPEKFFLKTVANFYELVLQKT